MEIEAKFKVADAKLLQRLRHVEQLGDYQVAAGRVKRIHDTYLDTGDHLLLAAGYVYRSRRQGQRILITVKELKSTGGDSIHRRGEWEVSLKQDLPPDQWPACSARERVLKVIGDKPLTPLVDLYQTRTTRKISSGGRPVAELYLDHVHVAAGYAVLAFLELECELLPQGTEDDLTALVAHLQADWKLSPQARSKFERAFEFARTTPAAASLLSPSERASLAQLAQLKNASHQRAQALLAIDEGRSLEEASQRSGLSVRRVQSALDAFRQTRLAIFRKRVLNSLLLVSDASPAPQRPVEASFNLDDAMAEAARQTLLIHFQRMLDHEAGTRAGQDTEELHDMRVATRRMRAALQVFERYLDQAAYRPFAKALRRTGRTLGAARDLDVFREKAQKYLDRLPPERQSELTPLLDVWQAEHDASRDNLLRYLDSDDYRQFVERFGEFLQTPGAGAAPIVSDEDEPRPYRVRHVLPGSLYAGYAQVRAYEEWLAGPEASLSRYHQLRIASKEMRYTLEFFRQVLAPTAKPMINAFKHLQDHLGELHDAVVTCDILRNFLMWGTWRPGKPLRKQPPAPVIGSPGAAAYLSARQAEIQTLLGTFSSVWSPLLSLEFRQQLTALVAGL